MIIDSLLDTDLYKFTMQQVVFHQFPEADVEYEFNNRSRGVDLRPLAGEIRDEIEHFCGLRLSPEELEYLGSIRYMQPSYVESLQRFRLDASQVHIDADGDLFRLRIRGNWYQTILFEVPVLAIINEVYFRRFQPGAASGGEDGEGMRRLLAKCAAMRDAGLPLALFEFGTRRRYSRDWQEVVVRTLAREVPGILKGTSNVHLAMKLGLRPFGTMAHEFLQACQVFAPIPEFQRFALERWMQEYRGDLGIALSDVVGMDAFFKDFDRLFCKAYDGCRHDSGDPFVWGDRLIEHYKAQGVDPLTKSAVFSDALTTERMIELARYFDGRIRPAFGVGTHLTNDLGFDSLGIVIKMVRCNNQPVAKLSDSPGKTICDDPIYLAYLRHVFDSRNRRP